jgi:hypothetical protein
MQATSTVTRSRVSSRGAGGCAGLARSAIALDNVGSASEDYNPGSVALFQAVVAERGDKLRPGRPGVIQPLALCPPRRALFDRQPTCFLSPLDPWERVIRPHARLLAPRLRPGGSRFTSEHWSMRPTCTSGWSRGSRVAGDSIMAIDKHAAGGISCLSCILALSCARRSRSTRSCGSKASRTSVR